MKVRAQKDNAFDAMRPATRKETAGGGTEGRRDRTSPLVQASAPRSVKEGHLLATLGKPLSREFLFYPGNLSRDRDGSGLCVAREPRLPRTQRRPYVHGHLRSQCHARRSGSQDSNHVDLQSRGIVHEGRCLAHWSETRHLVKALPRRLKSQVLIGVGRFTD